MPKSLAAGDSQMRLPTTVTSAMGSTDEYGRIHCVNPYEPVNQQLEFLRMTEGRRRD